MPDEPIVEGTPPATGGGTPPATGGGTPPAGTPPEVPITVPKERLDQVTARAHKAETELATLKKTQTDADQKSLEEKEEFKKLYGIEKGKGERLTSMETQVQTYFDEEVKDLTDDNKALIPDGPVENKLAWVKKAKAQGLFASKAPDVPPVHGGNQPPPSDPNKPWLALKKGDEKIANLSPAQYAEWKTHQKKLSGHANPGGPGWGF